MISRMSDSDSIDLAYWKQYFLDRVDELRAIAGTPFGFTGACILVEVLTRLTRGTGKWKSGRKEYEQFDVDWLDVLHFEMRARA